MQKIDVIKNSMNNNLQNVKTERDCTRFCKSKIHISQILSCITKKSISDQQIASYIFSLCCNFFKAQDAYGRTALHLATSCGRLDLCLWLLTVAGADVNKRDFESGYTPLHRSIYYGYINIAVKLMMMGSSIGIADSEDLTILDLLSMELTSQVDLSPNSPCQVYVWGNNNNYTLGIGSNDTRRHPELLDQFKKNNTSIVQVEMDEMHCLFRSKCGNVWSCGIGQGGRLGTGSQKPSITPQLIKTCNEPCILVALSINHTLLLLASGTILSFGSNSHYQLGISPYVEMTLCPKPVCSVNFSQSNPIKGILASRYHSVFFNDETIYVCGLNAGQLGLPAFYKSPLITAPRPVPLNLSERKITHVASSAGAIVVSVKNGDIYILHQYQCRKMASKLLDIVKIEVVGGNLDNKLVTEQGSELKVVILNSRGGLLLWQQSTQQIARCVFGMHRAFSVKDISLTQDHLFLVTNTGEAFRGHLCTQEKINSSSEVKNTFHKFLERSQCYQIKLHRFSNVFRAFAIKSDPKGNNFAVIQTHPKASLTDVPVLGTSEFGKQLSNLLLEASEDDQLHDVTFKIGGQLFSAHRYILSVNGNLLYNLSCKEDIVEINDINPYIFRQVLTFLYTGTCQLIQPGVFDDSVFTNKEDPIKLMLEVCARYKIHSLQKVLLNLRYCKGVISFKDFSQAIALAPPVFSRLDAPELHDVSLKSNSGDVIKAHKCILVARLHYFHCMLLGGWREANKVDECILKLPFSTKVMQDLVDFLYDEKIPSSITPDDLEHTIQLLVVSDQLLVSNLREACEIALTNALTLKNAVTLLQISSLYNTPQLKKAIMQFISLNLGVFLESRLLENLDDEILCDLTEYYRSFSGKAYRILTPFFDAPPDDEFEETNLVPWPDKFEMPDVEVSPAEKQIKKSKKRTTPRKSSNSESQDPCKVIEIVPSVEVTTVGETSVGDDEGEESPAEKVNNEQQQEKHIWKIDDFPSLKNEKPLTKTFSHKPVIDLAKGKGYPRLSQKERKRLQSQSESESLTPPSPAAPKETPTPKGWAIIPPPPAVVEQHDLRNSPKENFENETNFNSIIAHDIEKRSNWTKMKSKSFNLTQLEDKAIVELMTFYNANNEFDERITVQRLLPKNIDQPMWIKSKNKLFS